MSSLYSLKDDKIVVEGNTIPTEQGSSEAKTEDATKVTQEPPKEETTVNLNSAEKAKESKTPQSGDSQKEEMKNVPATHPVSKEEVDSHRSINMPSGSAKANSLTSNTHGRVLLKRRSSRLRTPTVGVSRNVAEEVDSSVPRAPKRRSTKKQMIALFSESDYPRRK